MQYSAVVTMDICHMSVMSDAVKLAISLQICGRLLCRLAVFSHGLRIDTSVIFVCVQ